ncbi:hypothetical protein GCM10010350_81230 [Streptomyces galilaeus]|nr:hypothetical protein GCM10010350_81230 [Streptomyces galilaeus]
MRVRDLDDFEWVVWRLEVQDPLQLAGEDPDLDKRTQETMTGLAASLGCVYEHCVDTDSCADGTRYYAWWVRLPAAEHVRRDRDGLPQAIGAAHVPDHPAKFRACPQSGGKGTDAGSATFWAGTRRRSCFEARPLPHLSRLGRSARLKRAR